MRKEDFINLAVKFGMVAVPINAFIIVLAASTYMNFLIQARDDKELINSNCEDLRARAYTKTYIQPNTNLWNVLIKLQPYGLVTNSTEMSKLKKIAIINALSFKTESETTETTDTVSSKNLNLSAQIKVFNDRIEKSKQFVDNLCDIMGVWKLWITIAGLNIFAGVSSFFFSVSNIIKILKTNRNSKTTTNSKESKLLVGVSAGLLVAICGPLTGIMFFSSCLATNVYNLYPEISKSALALFVFCSPSGCIFAICYGLYFYRSWVFPFLVKYFKRTEQDDTEMQVPIAENDDDIE